MRSYTIIAGVNGAGKTTLYNTNQVFEDVIRINLDETVRSFGSWKNKSDVDKAGMICVRRIQECIKNGVSFNQETTLCGKSIIKTIDDARRHGFVIEMYYIGLESPELAKERVHERVKRGGHGVPDEDIERRYFGSLRNLSLILHLCDRVVVYDNSERFVKIAEYENGICKWSAKKLPGWYIQVREKSE